MDPPFYIHSVEFWGAPNQWAVFERIPRGWRRASKCFKTSEPAMKLRDRMNSDWRRYQSALWAGRVVPKSHTL
jgi:hypothetical protein